MLHTGPARIAVIGAGAFGRRYVRALQALSGAEAAWVCDRDPEAAREAAVLNSVPRHTTDATDVCRDTDVDAVVVVTPEASHRQLAITALEAGKHVIVEKPLATEEENALAMAAAARRHDRLLMTAHLLRFDYRYAQIKQRLPALVTPNGWHIDLQGLTATDSAILAQ